MSKFYDDIARGCLPTGEPLENLYGVGWWTEEDEPEPEPEPAELEAERIEWVFEDQLPDGIPDAVYSAMYACSKVDFVRVFPAVTVDGRKRFLIELPGA